MRKEFRTFIAFSSLALSAAALPSAGAEVEAARATVPFPFRAGSVALPAGDYVVSQTNDRIVTIIGRGGHAMVVVGPSEPGSTPGTTASVLTFERTSKGNMLKEVQMYGSTSDLVKLRTPAAR